MEKIRPCASPFFYVLNNRYKTWPPKVNKIVNQYAIVVDRLEARLNENQPCDSPCCRERILHQWKYGDL